MTDAELRREIERLREEIARHDRLYFREAAPEISDQEYDELLRRLRELETEHPALAGGDSPTRTPGADTDVRFPSEAHSRPMLQLPETMSHTIGTVTSVIRKQREYFLKKGRATGQRKEEV